MQGSPPGSGMAWLLKEMHRRIALFMYQPERVVDYVPWAVAPFFANSDEQTIMNDVLVSAVTNVTYYVGSTAAFEVLYCVVM